MATLPGFIGRGSRTSLWSVTGFSSTHTTGCSGVEIVTGPIVGDPTARVLLVPLIGHTTGHCGVAIQQETGWLLHVGDSYYRRVEITRPEHPVAAMAKNFAADNNARIDSLEKLRSLSKRTDVTFFCAHDYSEYASKENPLNVDLPRA